MVRPLATATANKLDTPIIPLAAIVYLDVLGDPLYAWTGIGDLDFGSVALGPELVNDPDFNVPASWNAFSGASVAGGKAITGANVFAGVAQNIVGVNAGTNKTYQLDILVNSEAPNYLAISVGEQGLSSTNQLGPLPLVAGLNSFTFTTLSANSLGGNPVSLAIQAYYSGGNLATAESMSLKEILGGFPSTGDNLLDNNIFKGIGDIIQVSTVSEGVGGSDALEIQLPGVDLNSNEMKQIIRDRKRWQFKRAVIWLMLINEVSGLIEGLPFRIKTGRIDSMPYDEKDNEGIIKAVIEGQQAYGDEPLNTRYSEQVDLNAADTSQKWVWALANMSAVIGHATAPELNQALGGSGGGGGSGSITRLIQRL